MKLEIRYQAHLGGPAPLVAAEWLLGNHVKRRLMKPDNKFPPFNADLIPLWLYPDLFDETKYVPNRCWKFVGLYMLSVLANGLILMGPVALYAGSPGYKTILGFWLVIGVSGGIGVGLFTWRDFNREVKRLAGVKEVKNL